jgi:ubiquitin-like 1-activating enzyme E1 B
VKIPTKPKKTPAPETNGQNGHVMENGSRQQSIAVSEITPAKRPHPDEPEDTVASKKARTAAGPTAGEDDEIVVLDDSAGGAIVIDDD